jgi:hypothetical protein
MVAGVHGPFMFVDVGQDETLEPHPGTSESKEWSSWDISCKPELKLAVQSGTKLESQHVHHRLSESASVRCFKVKSYAKQGRADKASAELR